MEDFGSHLCGRLFVWININQKIKNMYCSNCGNKLKEGVNFCEKCGHSVKEDNNTHIATHKKLMEEKIIREVDDKDKIDFFIVPTGRLILLSILSFGFYSIYWFAKNFYAIKNRRKLRGEKTKEWWAIFNTITSNTLFHEFYLMYHEATGKKFKVPSWVFAILYFILMVASSYVLLTPIVFISKALIFQSLLKKYKYIGLYHCKKVKFKTKEIGIVIIGIVIISLSYWSQSEDIKNTKLTYSDMQEIVSDMNKDLPEMMDSDTRLDNVIAGEDSLTYNYTLINYLKGDFEFNEIKNSLKEGIVKGICTSSDMEIYVNNNTTFYYQYFDKDDNFIETISVFPYIDCSSYK
jgi:ribosomal protein L37AE/L43A